MSADGEYPNRRVTRLARVTRGPGHRHRPLNSVGEFASHSVANPLALRAPPGALPRAGDPRILQLPLPELAPSRAFARRLPGFVGPTPSTNLDTRCVTSTLVFAHPSTRNGVQADGMGPSSGKNASDTPPRRATMGDCLKRHPRSSAALDSSAAPVAHRPLSAGRGRDGTLTGEE